MGGLIIGILFSRLNPAQKSVGVVHVIERLSYHEGRLPWRNAVRQFLGAAIALISGHSVGREGPSVHLGAASGSLLGISLDLPNNGIQVLVASGSAAAIAASFNTPCRCYLCNGSHHNGLSHCNFHPYYSSVC